jgi:hypothetical protein
MFYLTILKRRCIEARADFLCCTQWHILKPVHYDNKTCTFFSDHFQLEARKTHKRYRYYIGFIVKAL